jgi:hypothetical protein
LGIGDWGLGIGDWGVGPIPNPQSPIPNICFIIDIYYNKVQKNKNIKVLKFYILKIFDIPILILFWLF